MRKIFLLIPALLLALVVNADEINISSGTSNIIHYTIADSNTKDGDVIVLTDAGPYISTAGVDDYTKLVKNLTIKAADGINPVIKLEVPFRSTGGKSVKFIGITFDGTSLSSSYDFYFRFYDNADNLEFEDCEFKNISKYIFDVYTDKSANSLVIKNCNFHDVSSRGILNRGTIGEINISGSTFSSFTDYPIIHNYSNGSIGKIKIDGSEFYSNAKYLINGEATSHADSCIITNCYFHNNSRSAVYFAASTVDGVETCDGVIVKNSTFANNDMSASDGSVIEVRNYNAAVASNIEVTVDHCTFYNNPTSASGYAAIRSYKSTKVNVSNCIFAHPTSYDRCGTYCYGGNVTNCLAYNLTSGTNGHHSGPTLTGNFTADPLFADAANGDFSLAGNWVTMNLSPARGAATDGSDLGDPRWYSAEVLPDVDFASPYQFIGTKAVLNGNIRLNASNHIEYYDKSECGTAKWKIHATRACVLQATLNMESGSSSGHIFRVEFLDADGNHVDEVAEPAESSHDGNIDLPNSLSIPAAGDYIVILHNDKSWSSAVIEGVTLTYVGGAVITVPAEELIGEEAVLVDAGHLKVSKLANGDLKYGDNGNQLDEYVYWNINATKAGDMKVTLNVVAPEVGDASTHNFLVELYSDLNAAPIASSAEASATSGTGARELPDLINIPATGNYIIKLTNQTQWSSAILHSIQFEYVGGAVINIPAEEMIGEDAVIVDEGHKKVYKDADGNLQYNDNSTPLGEYVYWNINATEAGDMNVTLNVVAPEVGPASGHQFLVELYSDLNASPIASSAEASSTSATGARELPDVINIPATGSYIIKLTNQTQWSSAILHSITFTAAPVLSNVTIDDNATDNSAWVANVGGAAVNAELTRTFVGGMYNTISLPFAVSSEKVVAAFGAGVELMEMTDATLDGTVLDFVFTPTTSIYQGTPYLIKPTADVANPQFNGVEFVLDNAAGSASGGTNADFIGTFVKTTILADVNNLYLQSGNVLKFSENDVTIKGTRAYFHVDVPSGILPVVKPRIVMNGQVITDIELINGEPVVNGKFIENGQLIIIRDGVRYNALGVRVK